MTTIDKQNKIYIYYDRFNGNDQTGDGTKKNPFKTQYKAVMSLPEDLNFDAIFVPININKEEK